MTPLAGEGEPEYSEQYACVHCGFHDTIPALAIITSQFITALLGIAVSVYLTLDSASILFSATTPGSTAAVAEESALITISVLFALGFIYVLHQALSGFLKRRAYLGHEAMEVPS